MRNVALALALASLPLAAQQGHGWVWIAPNSTWHLKAKDKQFHFVAGFVAGSVSYLALDEMKIKNPGIWAGLIAFLVGYAKEVYDLRRSGTAERADWANTALGGIAGVTIAKLRW